ncbi:MAG: UTP--glucose-1-phosphate uridylyltransferase [Planctomycetota bacterium]
MNDLDPRTADSLRTYGFNSDQQSRWQEKVRSGVFAQANNLVQGPLSAPPAGSMHSLPEPGSDDWKELEAIGLDAMARGEFAVCVLNGGMATRFGGVVKGVVEVRDGRSFLGMAIDNANDLRKRSGGRVRVFLMNSFATDDATKQHFAEHKDFGYPAADIEHFTQFVALRMAEDGELFRLDNGEPSPYGPGHGDFDSAFRASGCLQRFLDDGGKYVFVRNVDNLGALGSPAVLGHHIQSGKQMTAEQTKKRAGDVGGAPYLFDERVQLVEQLRFPAGFDASIVDVFNTNTMTFTAEALLQPRELGRYFVKKKVEGRAAVQIEHLIGELTAHLTTNFLAVPRDGTASRFLPIKTPDDLTTARPEIDQIYGS